MAEPINWERQAQQFKEELDTTNSRLNLMEQQRNNAQAEVEKSRSILAALEAEKSDLLGKLERAIADKAEAREMVRTALAKLG